MSRADELLAQYQKKIGKVGQWIAVRRYTAGTPRTYSDTLTRAYLRYQKSNEFVGAVSQQDVVAIALATVFSDWNPEVGPTDQLVTGFHGYDDAGNTPALDGSGHVNGKVRAITSAMKRDPEGRLIALEIHAVG